MVVETLWPDNAPWWLNLFIWMATFWWYILVGFVPAFYIAVAKLFGMPLLQRWSQEVVIMLYPTKVKFAKITQQPDPYFKYGKGIFFPDSPLTPKTFETSFDQLPEKIQVKLETMKKKYETLQAKEGKTKKDEIQLKKLMKQGERLLGRGLKVEPRNQVHIFSHAVNQPIYKMERNDEKIRELINNNPNPKRIPGHGVWLLQNPKLHFHRHYQLIVEQDGSYQLIPVKDRQQFSIGFWHSLGIVMYEEVQEQKTEESESSGQNGKRMQQVMVTTNVVLKQTKVVQSYQNYSASRFFSILKDRAKIEYGFDYWIQGAIDPRIFLVLGGMVAAVAVIFIFLHGGGSPSAPGPTGPKMIL